MPKAVPEDGNRQDRINYCCFKANLAAKLLQIIFDRRAFFLKLKTV
jgi:hypothetical protein